MELDKKRFRIIRILVILVIILFGTIAALGLFDHPVEVMILAVPLVAFQVLILSWQSLKWVLISGIITVIVLLVELFINIFYYHVI